MCIRLYEKKKKKKEKKRERTRTERMRFENKSFEDRIYIFFRDTERDNRVVPLQRNTAYWACISEGRWRWYRRRDDDNGGKGIGPPSDINL